MPMISVELFPGRSLETKRELVAALTETYVRVCGGTPQAVHILLKEVSPADWAVGGELYSDVMAAKAAK